MCSIKYKKCLLPCLAKKVVYIQFNKLTEQNVSVAFSIHQDHGCMRRNPAWALNEDYFLNHIELRLRDV